MNSLRDKLQHLLSKEFNPEHLEIIDETDKHKNHLNTPHTKETHFRILIVSEIFQSMNRIERHRCIMSLFEQDFKAHLHALSIKAFTPNEYQKFPKTKVALSDFPLHT
ncbi:MAG: BolA family transcriptional regulator [Candidatus Paracaedimonas acanthamoebae]|uniref:BolA family transcriptional regulator n=1 Tax=Candidatus Paracaedimonas acanthamoebae TaxID=244581 RepID=A0A8J7PJI7_9PROT|nr:BolA family transcriptional regulator [Candidatus Paracaedimonas acanthamoebae]